MSDLVRTFKVRLYLRSLNLILVIHFFLSSIGGFTLILEQLETRVKSLLEYKSKSPNFHIFSWISLKIDAVNVYFFLFSLVLNKHE